MSSAMHENSQPVDETTSATGSSRPRHRGRKFLWLAMILLTLSLLVTAAPTLLSQAIRTRTGMSWIAPDVQGNIDVGQAELSWDQPMVLKDVTVSTPEGKPVARVESVRSQGTLWDLFTQPNRPLFLSLNKLATTVVIKEPAPMKPDASLSALLREIEKFRMPRPKRSMQVDISDARIKFVNESGELLDEWSSISGLYEYDKAATQTQSIELAVPPSADGDYGSLILAGSWKAVPVDQTKSATATSAVREEMHWRIDADDMSLAALRPHLDPLEQGDTLTHCTGVITGEFVRSPLEGWNVELSADLQDSELVVCREDSPLALHAVAFQADSPPVDEFHEPGLSEPDEPLRLRFELEGRYSKVEDQLTIPRLFAFVDGSELIAQAEVTDVSSTEFVDLTAEVVSPGKTLSDFFPESIRDKMLFEGLRLGEIRMAGALRGNPAEEDVPAFRVSMDINWDSIEAFGLVSKGGSMQVGMTGNEGYAQPINVPLSGGKLLALPRVRFAGPLPVQPLEITFPENQTLLENVELTEELCRGWLRYVSPTLANATAADGRFSLSVSQGQIPVGEIENGSLSGTFTVHSGQVRPGPLAVEMIEKAGMLQRLIQRRTGVNLTEQPWLIIDPQEVHFELKDGRVYHDRFAFSVGPMPATTTGSVGIDDTLDLVLTFEIPNEWVANLGPILQSLGGEQIPLKIQGTMNEPDIDTSGIGEFGKRIGAKAGANLLERILERRMQRGRGR